MQNELSKILPHGGVAILPRKKVSGHLPPMFPKCGEVVMIRRENTVCILPESDDSFALAKVQAEVNIWQLPSGRLFLLPKDEEFDGCYCGGTAFIARV